MIAVPQLSLTIAMPAVTPPPAPPRGVGYITLDEAARRSGKSLGQLRRLCQDKYAPAGYAEQRRPEGGGKPTWAIREDADAQFCRVKSDEQLEREFDWTPFNDDQRKEMQFRRWAITEWDRKISAGHVLNVIEAKVTGSFLLELEVAKGRKLSRATLFNWRAAYKRDNLYGLVDDRWKPPTQRQPDDDPFIAYVLQLFLKPRKMSLSECVKYAELQAEEKGWAVRNYKMCQRAAARVPAAVVTRMREGEKAFVDKHEPFISRDYSKIESNDVWCADHHPFDVLVRIGEKVIRPHITGFEDMRSRKIMGYWIGTSHPNTDTILAAFRAGARANGIPRRVYVDNGADFASKALLGETKAQRRKRTAGRRGGDTPIDAALLSGVFGRLQVGVMQANPYHGQSKLIERYFGTLARSFSKWWDTHTGNSTADKPRNLVSKDHLKSMVDRGHAPTLAEFTAAFENWLEEMYHNQPHSGDAMNGRTPNDVYAACLIGKRVTIANELLDVETRLRLSERSGRPIHIGQQGVTYRGLHYGAFEPELIRRQEQPCVLLVAPEEGGVADIIVADPDGRPIARVTPNMRLSPTASNVDLRAALAMKRKARKVALDYQKQRAVLTDDLPSLVNRAAMRRKRDALPPGDGPSLRPVRTGIEEHLPSLQNMLAPRLAVGAEGFTPDRNDDGPSLSELMRGRLQDEPEDL